MKYFTYITTALGSLIFLSNGSDLTGLFFDGQKHMPILDQSWQKNDTLPLFILVKQQVAQYLHGTRQVFDIPYALTNGTIFQQKVWGAISRIPCGSLISYRRLAELVGMPQGVRAVASAVGRNPISLIIPCHRIIGSDGALTGYAGGLERKQYLLNIEKTLYQ